MSEGRRRGGKGQPESFYAVFGGSKGQQGKKRSNSGNDVVQNLPKGKTLEGAVLTGWIKSFNNRTGYGFVESEAIKSKDIFLHESELSASSADFKVGDCVKFTLMHNELGEPQACMVRLISEPSLMARSAGPPSKRGRRAEIEFDEDWEDDYPLDPRQHRKGSEGDGAEYFFIGDGNGARQRDLDKVPPLNKIRVLNMPWTLTRQEIKAEFETVGEVLNVRLDERKVGQAVISFRDPASAEEAVKEYHRGTLHGREILVRYADKRLNAKLAE